jgi:hypothetical protein
MKRLHECRDHLWPIARVQILRCRHTRCLEHGCIPDGARAVDRALGYEEVDRGVDLVLVA